MQLFVQVIIKIYDNIFVTDASAEAVGRNQLRAKLSRRGCWNVESTTLEKEWCDWGG